jgi:hypothetical protein
MSSQRRAFSRLMQGRQRISRSVVSQKPTSGQDRGSPPEDVKRRLPVSP